MEIEEKLMWWVGIVLVASAAVMLILFTIMMAGLIWALFSVGFRV